MVSDDIAWGFVRVGAVISLSIAPIVLALLLLRWRARRAPKLQDTDPS